MDPYRPLAAIQPSRSFKGQGVQRAGGSSGSDFQYMGIDHRRAHIRVSQQLRYRANVGAGRKQVRGEAVMQGVHRNGFANADLCRSLLQCAAIASHRGDGAARHPCAGTPTGLKQETPRTNPSSVPRPGTWPPAHAEPRQHRAAFAGLPPTVRALPAPAGAGHLLGCAGASLLDPCPPWPDAPRSPRDQKSTSLSRKRRASFNCMREPYSRRASSAISVGNAIAQSLPRSPPKQKKCAYVCAGAERHRTMAGPCPVPRGKGAQCAQRLVVRGCRYPPLVGQHGQKNLEFLPSHVSRTPQTVPFHKLVHHCP